MNNYKPENIGGRFLEPYVRQQVKDIVNEVNTCGAGEVNKVKVVTEKETPLDTSNCLAFQVGNNTIVEIEQLKANSKGEFA